MKIEYTSYKKPNIVLYLFMALIVVHAVYTYDWIYALTFYLINCISVRLIKIELSNAIIRSFDFLDEYENDINQNVDIDYFNKKLNALFTQAFIVHFIFVGIIYSVFSIINYHELTNPAIIVLVAIIRPIYSKKCKQLIKSQFINYTTN